MNTPTNKYNNNTPMKPFIYSAIVALFLASCGQEATTDLGKLQAQRDSLKKERTNISDQIKSLELEINELDTNYKERVTNVTTLALAPTSFEHFFNVQGVVETDQNAQIFAEAPGKINSIKVKEGDKVKKGQVLMTIDSRIVNNQIDELKGRLTLAKTVFEKQEALWKKNIGSEIQFLESKNNYESLQQNIETLQAQQAMYTVTAPFSGVIDEITPKVGEMANPAMPAFRLINTDIMYVKADITERYLGQIKEGDKVMIEFPSANAKVESKIDRIGSFINPNNRSFKIKLLLDNADKTLKPNMLGELKVRDYKSDSTVVIPTALIQITPTGEEFVYVVKNEEGRTIAVKTMIKSGMTYDNNSEVIEGLNGSEKLVNRGARSIKDGDVVKTEA
jgi:membrane fusion protein (multidrug efflux system)